MTTADVQTPRLMTTRELAQYLNVHPKTIARWMRLTSDALPCVRVRSRVRFNPSDVAAWVAGRRAE